MCQNISNLSTSSTYLATCELELLWFSLYLATHKVIQLRRSVTLLLVSLLPIDELRKIVDCCESSAFVKQHLTENYAKTTPRLSRHFFCENATCQSKFTISKHIVTWLHWIQSEFKRQKSKRLTWTVDGCLNLFDCSPVIWN